MSLQDLFNAIATNSLSAEQQAPLLEALAVLIPEFPDVEQGAVPSELGEAIANTWAAPLYALAFIPGGGPPPVSGVASVTAHAPLVQSGTAADVVLDLPNATAIAAGAMSAADKAALDAVVAGTPVTTGWTSLFTDAPVTLYTTPALASNVEASIVTYVELVQIGTAGSGGSVTRKCVVQNIGGTITSLLNDATSNVDFDVSSPPPPGNVSNPMAGAAAHLVPSGTALQVQVTRPTGVPCYARVTTWTSELVVPTDTFILAVTPSTGSTSGGQAVNVTVSGNGTLATGVTLDGVAAAIQPGATSTNIPVLTGVAGGTGTGPVGVTFASGPPAIDETTGFTYTTGIIPTVTSITPDVARGEGFTPGFTYVVKGSGFTGASQMLLSTVVYTAGVDFTIIDDATIHFTVVKATASAQWGIGDVRVRSSTGDLNPAGNHLWYVYPNGLFSWHESFTVTGGGGVTTSNWTDIGATGGSAQYNMTSGAPFLAADAAFLGSPQSVGQQNGVFNPLFPRSNPSSFAGTALTFQATMIRTVLAPGPGTYLLSLFNSTSGLADTADPSSIVVLDPGDTTLVLERHSVSQASAAATAPGIVNPFSVVVQDSGSVAVLRINGTQIATIATDGTAYNIIEYTFGSGWGGAFQVGPNGASRYVSALIWGHALSPTDLATVSAITTARFGLAA